MEPAVSGGVFGDPPTLAPLSYRVTVLPHVRTGLVATSGRVTGRELADACGHLAHDALWRTGFNEVWDLSESDEVDVSPGGFDDLVECTREYASRVGHNRVAFVTSRDEVTILLRLFEQLTSDLGRTYFVARSRAEAAEWLGLAPDALAGASAEA